MSANVVGMAEERAAGFYDSTIGKKAVMAVSGIVLFGFLIGHLAGNLQFFAGPEPLNEYARFLHDHAAALWGARIVLLLMVGLHIWSSILLAARKQAARPHGYVRKKSVASTYASRTMYWSGPIIAAFVIYHLLDFTFGVANPSYEQGNVYANIVRSFSVPLVSIFYIVAMVLLGMHLFHGLWSMFQTLGAHHPRYTPLLRRLGALCSILLVAGFISIPLAVLLGYGR